MTRVASVTLRTEDGREHTLGHGDLIGRVWSAALQLEDGRISEAHAMVSLRGRALKLLALRGLFATDGKALKELDLEEGQVIHLARGVSLEVVGVVTPDSVWVLRGDGLGQVTLSGVCSLVTRPAPRIRPGAREDARVVFFLGAEGWRARVGDDVVPLTEGWSFEEGDVRVEASLEGLEDASGATRLAGRVDPPLRVLVRFDSVTVERDGYPPVRVAGKGARLISELAAVGAPLHWEALCRELWSDDADPVFLRRRFDAVLHRLRHKLVAAGIRRDLVRSDHSGLFELVLRQVDILVDENG